MWLTPEGKWQPYIYWCVDDIMAELVERELLDFVALDSIPPVGPATVGLPLAQH